MKLSSNNRYSLNVFFICAPVSAILSFSSHGNSQRNHSKSLLSPFSLHYFQDSMLWISGYSEWTHSHQDSIVFNPPVAAPWQTQQRFSSSSDFKDNSQCSVTSVLLYRVHTWLSALCGRMFYNHMFALFSVQAPEWQSKQSHLSDSKHRRQETWWRNSRPLSIHYLSEINESFLWPTWRKIRMAFTRRCSEIHQYMSAKQ